MKKVDLCQERETFCLIESPAEEQYKSARKIFFYQKRRNSSKGTVLFTEVNLKVQFGLKTERVDVTKWLFRKLFQ